MNQRKGKQYKWEEEERDGKRKGIKMRAGRREWLNGDFFYKKTCVESHIIFV